VLVCVCVWGISLSCFLPAFSIFLCTQLWRSTFFYPLSTFSHHRIECTIVKVQNKFSLLLKSYTWRDLVVKAKTQRVVVSNDDDDDDDDDND
jgi:hypothetical protein